MCGFKRKQQLKTSQKWKKRRRKNPPPRKWLKRSSGAPNAFFHQKRKIRIVLEGLRGEDSIAAICRKYDLHINTYYSWSKEFMEAGKRRLSGDITREATRDEVSDLKAQNDDLKKVLAELYLENKSLKKSLNGYE